MQVADSQVETSSFSSSNGPWHVSGVVLASPGAGQIKAVMPALNVYSDIRIEDMKAFGSTQEPVLPSKSDESDEEEGMERAELDSTLSDIEKRMDERIYRIEKAEDRRADAYRREQEARDKLYSERFEAMHRRLEDRDKVIDSKLDAMNQTIQGISEKVSSIAGAVATIEARVDGKIDSLMVEVKDSNRTAVKDIRGIAIASVLGLLAINATMIFGAKSFFDTGKEMAELQTTMKDAKEILQGLQQKQAITPPQQVNPLPQQQTPSTAPSSSKSK